MTFSIRRFGAWATPGTVKRRSGGGWVGVTSIRRRSGGTWVTVWSAFSATASPSTLFGTTKVNGARAQTSSPSTVTVSGGSGTVAYSWEFVSGDTVITPNTPASASTYFGGKVGVLNPDRSAVYRCRVTNGDGSVTYTNNVSISLAYVSGT